MRTESLATPVARGCSVFRSESVVQLYASPPRLPSTPALHDLHTTADGFQRTAKMPVLFVGHSSVMNALAGNQEVSYGGLGMHTFAVGT